MMQRLDVGGGRCCQMRMLKMGGAQRVDAQESSVSSLYRDEVVSAEHNATTEPSGVHDLELRIGCCHIVETGPICRVDRVEVRPVRRGWREHHEDDGSGRDAGDRGDEVVAHAQLDEVPDERAQGRAPRDRDPLVLSQAPPVGGLGTVDLILRDRLHLAKIRKRVLRRFHLGMSLPTWHARVGKRVASDNRLGFGHTLLVASLIRVVAPSSHGERDHRRRRTRVRDQTVWQVAPWRGLNGLQSSIRRFTRSRRTASLARLCLGGRRPVQRSPPNELAEEFAGMLGAFLQRGSFARGETQLQHCRTPFVVRFEWPAHGYCNDKNSRIRLL